MELIAYGKVVKPHGLSGEVKVLPFSGDSDSFSKFSALYISKDKTDQKKLLISSSRNQKNLIIVKLKGIDTIEHAESLRGLNVFIDKEELPPKDEDEYYWFELIGLEVFDKQNILIGSVTGIIDNTAQPVLVVKDSNNEILVPLVDKFVEKIDLENSRIIIHHIESLI